LLAVVSLVAKRDKVLAARIERALINQQPLDELSADKDVVPPSQRPKPETLRKRKDEARQRKGKGLRGQARADAMRDRLIARRGEGDAKREAREKARARRRQFKGR
jgi:hypothetical protein